MPATGPLSHITSAQTQDVYIYIFCMTILHVQRGCLYFNIGKCECVCPPWEGTVAWRISISQWPLQVGWVVPSLGKDTFNTVWNTMSLSVGLETHRASPVVLFAFHHIKKKSNNFEIYEIQIKKREVQYSERMDTLTEIGRQLHIKWSTYWFWLSFI